MFMCIIFRNVHHISQNIQQNVAQKDNRQVFINKIEAHSVHTKVNVVFT